MPHIPERVKSLSIVPALAPYLVKQGKVRDIYELPEYSGYQVVVTSDRLSIFDFVLPVEVSKKGEVLTALTHYWLLTILGEIPNQLWGSAEQPFDCMGVLRKIKQQYDIPLARTLVVKKLHIMPFELIFRGHLGGSVWKKYQAGEPICGQVLPSGLKKWQKLAEPLFTPTTKAESGHDEAVTVQEFYEVTGEAGRATVELLRNAYATAYDFAVSHGLLILDTKFEATVDGWLGDEILTPDSSRYCPKELLVPGQGPPFWDKEPVRKWGKEAKLAISADDGQEKLMGIDELSPQNPQHLAMVEALVVPEEVIQETTERYLQLFKTLTGMSLDEYQRGAVMQ